jgi:hypothetical protein
LKTNAMLRIIRLAKKITCSLILIFSDNLVIFFHF